jgi:hypothetical protein
LPKPGGEEVAGGIAPYNFVVREEGLAAKARVEATADCTFTVFKDAVLLGYLTFLAGQKIAVPTLVSGSVTAGQLVSIKAPIAVDDTLEDIAFLVTEGG